MFVRFYNKCVMCDKVYYEPEKTGCTTPSVACPECRKYYKRAKQLKKVSDDIDYKFIRRLLDVDKCKYCGKELDWFEREIEHKTPVSRGGDNRNSNLCISCHQCNVEKGKRTYKEYLDYKDSIEISSSDIKSISNIFFQYDLLKTETVVEDIKEAPQPIHKLIRDKDGNITGLRKVFFDPVYVRKITTKTFLTDWGKAYNAFCEVVGRKKILKEDVKIRYLDIQEECV